MQKNKMKNKLSLMFGVFLLFTLLPLTSALYPCDWNTYGGELTHITNNQYYSDCKGQFGISAYTQESYPSGMGQAGYQPLIAGVGEFEEPRVVIQNGNYLQVFDENMDLVTEFNTGELVGSMDIGNFFGDDKYNGIIGIWRDNLTALTYKVFEFDEETDTLNLRSNFSFSFGTNTYSNGLRCLSGQYESDTECYSVLQYVLGSEYFNTFIRFNTTGGYSAKYLNNTDELIIEPVSWSDWDNDDVDEFLIWSKDKWFIYDFENEVIEKEVAVDTTDVHSSISSARFFYPLDAQQNLNWLEKLIYPNANKGRLIVSTHCEQGTWTCNSRGGCGYHSETLTAYKPDFSVMWSECYGSLNSADRMYLQGVAIGDYNGDYKDDVWFAIHKSNSNPQDAYYIKEGGSGDTIYSYGRTYGDSVWGSSIYPNAHLEIFKANYDDTPDFLISSGGRVEAFDTTSDSILMNKSNVGACVPADLNFDGLQDIVCSKSSSTDVFYVNYTNQNSYINSVIYDPSTVINVNSTLYTIISATDDETDQIFYAISCDTGEAFSNFSSSNAPSCSYNTIGDYSVTVAVKDIYHEDYNTFSQNIIVTQNSNVCDNDGICEASQGETYLNCPADCDAPVGEVNDTSTATGGIPVPTKLVDVDNVNSGLLPEIYYGTIGFMSSVLSPTILLVFVIFFALIMITIGGIVKKIAQKVAENGR